MIEGALKLRSIEEIVDEMTESYTVNLARLDII